MRFTGIETTVHPKFLPISVRELKEALRFPECDSTEDQYLGSLIAAATMTAEAFQRRTIVERQYRMYLDCLPSVIMPINPNLKSVEQILYLDWNGVQQVIPAEDYIVDLVSVPGRITKAYSSYWPNVYPVINSVSIEYTAGYPKVDGTLVDWNDKILKVTLAESIPPQGVVYVINSLGQYEAMGYRNAFNDGGEWSLYIGNSSEFTFSAGNAVEVHFIPEQTRQGILAIATDTYEHPSMQSEISLYDNKLARMLLGIERVSEFY